MAGHHREWSRAGRSPSSYLNHSRRNGVCGPVNSLPLHGERTAARCPLTSNAPAHIQEQHESDNHITNIAIAYQEFTSLEAPIKTHKSGFIILQRIYACKRPFLEKTQHLVERDPILNRQPFIFPKIGVTKI